MEKLTKEEAIKRHRMMWNWMANESLRLERKVHKSSAVYHFDWGDILSACWCCEYDSSKWETYRNYCANCPLQWPGEHCSTQENGEVGLYKQWFITKDYKKAAELAYQIANLPEREDVE